MTLHSATTETLPVSLLRQLRTLLDAAFQGDFSEDDWQHALGGIHVWITGAEGVISHGSLVPRTLICSGNRMRAGYVEAVATASSWRNKGLGTRVMRHIGGLIDQRYVLGALSTGAPRFYERLGWEPWRGPTFVDGQTGLVRTPDDDRGILILRTPFSPRLNLDGEIVCDWREGDVW